MDRNTLIGLVLIFVIIAGSVFLMKPSDEEIKKERERQEARKQSQSGTSVAADEVNLLDVDSLDSPATQNALDSAQLAGPFGTALAGEEQLIVLENELIRATLTTHGGRVKSVELINETTHEGDPLILFDGDHNKFGLFFSSAGKNI